MMEKSVAPRFPPQVSPLGGPPSTGITNDVFHPLAERWCVNRTRGGDVCAIRSRGNRALNDLKKESFGPFAPARDPLNPPTASGTEEGGRRRKALPPGPTLVLLSPAHVAANPLSFKIGLRGDV
jgi:hypothetical protein